MPVEQAKVEMRRLTRIFVRRQANWFKLVNPSIHWFEAAQPEVVSEIEQVIGAFLNESV
jgi:tRNA dimethylallyltransferase